jgi:hypothetical protein
MQNWTHLTESTNVFTRLSNITLRLRRVLLSRQIRHLEQMVKGHSTHLKKMENGPEQIKKITKLMEDIRKQIGETCG